MRQKRSVNANKTRSLFYDDKKNPLQEKSVNANKTHSLFYETKKIR